MDILGVNIEGTLFESERRTRKRYSASRGDGEKEKIYNVQK